MKKSWFTIVKIQKGLYALAEFSHFENVVSYLLLGEKQAVLFDTGMGYGNIKEAIKSITTLPVTVLLTHGHWDHIGSVHEFAKVGMLDNSYERNLLLKGFYSNQIDELTNPSYFTEPFKPFRYAVGGRTPSFVFHDTNTIYIDKYHIHVIATPGHTPGSTCFFIEELGILGVGDSLYPGPIYLHLPESDFDDYSGSIAKLMSMKKKIQFILPGHNAVRAKTDLLIAANDLCRGVKHGSNPIRHKGWDEYSGDTLSLLLPKDT